jgi:TonB family protein
VAGVTGEIVVEVKVDERGKVESAEAISGPPELRQTAVEAAKQWEFKPTSLSGTAVKVIGRLTFNFRR